MNRLQNKEFFQIVEPIVFCDEFLSLQEMNHHGITRYDHSLRVAYYTFLITKGLGLNYRDATVAALLHDFFMDEVKDKNIISRLRKHPMIAVENAKKLVSINEFQEDIIRCHMFPITFTPPKYLEGWIVDLVDDVSAVYEKVMTTKKEFSAAVSFLFFLFVGFFQ